MAPHGKIRAKCDHSNGHFLFYFFIKHISEDNVEPVWYKNLECNRLFNILNKNEAENSKKKIK